MSLYETTTSKLTSTQNESVKQTTEKSKKEHFDIDFTCCTSCCSYDDYDW